MLISNFNLYDPLRMMASGLAASIWPMIGLSLQASASPANALSAIESSDAFGPCLPDPNFAQGAAASVKTCDRSAADVYSSSKAAILKQKMSPLEKTPDYLHQIMHPGIVYDLKKSTGYKISDKKLIPISKIRESYTELQELLENDPVTKQELADVCDKDSPDARGCWVQWPLDRPDRYDLFYDTPGLSRLENHKKAVRSIRSWIGRIGELSDSDIVANILKAHKTLFQGIKGSRAGQWRINNVIVQSEPVDKSNPDAVLEVVRSKGGSERDVKRIFEYSAASSTTEKDRPMTAEEVRSWSYLGFVPCHWELVPEKMGQLAKELKQIIVSGLSCGKIDVLALGAFIHGKIGEIHPFEDGNGRISRALLNAILMEFGIDPVVFIDHEEYIQKTLKALQTPKIFTEYLYQTLFGDTKKARAVLEKV